MTIKLKDGSYIAPFVNGLALFYADGSLCRRLDPYLETELAQMLADSQCGDVCE